MDQHNDQHNDQQRGQPTTNVAPATAATAADPLTLIPTTVLPDGPARRALAAMMCLGADTDECRVYHPRNRERGWQTPENLRIWLAPPDPAWDTRMTPAEWLTAYATATCGPTGEAFEELHARYQRLKSLHSLTPLLWDRAWDRAGADGPNSIELTGEPTADDHWRYPARRPEDVAAETALEHAITVLWWLQRVAGVVPYLPDAPDAPDGNGGA